MGFKKIIREEIKSFINEFYGDDEPSIADKYYEKNLGIRNKEKKREQSPSDGELIGAIEKSLSGAPFKDPQLVYKNPINLSGFDYHARGILTQNGDLFLLKGDNALHDDMLRFLIEKGIIRNGVSLDYPKDYPEEYVAVERFGLENVFVPSSLYASFPSYYVELFEKATNKHSYKFKKYHKDDDEEMDEQLDMNRAYSYIPRDMDPNRVFGGGLDAGLNEKKKK